MKNIAENLNKLPLTYMYLLSKKNAQRTSFITGNCLFVKNKHKADLRFCTVWRSWMGCPWGGGRTSPCRWFWLRRSTPWCGNPWRLISDAGSSPPPVWKNQSNTKTKNMVDLLVQFNSDYFIALHSIRVTEPIKHKRNREEFDLWSQCCIIMNF